MLGEQVGGQYVGVLVGPGMVGVPPHGMLLLCGQRDGWWWYCLRKEQVPDVKWSLKEGG